jgi:hypothetical protein
MLVSRVSALVVERDWTLSVMRPMQDVRSGAAHRLGE